MTDELTKLRTALAESQTRERIAVQELQRMRQRAQDAEKALQELRESTSTKYRYAPRKV
jgi:hypothetical protein